MGSGRERGTRLLTAYHFCARPAEVAHQHPYLVFDCQEELHLPLTGFAKGAHTRLASSSVKTDLPRMLPFFTCLYTDPCQAQPNHHCPSPPERSPVAIHY